ncbi:hypothetical protein UlMin_007502 [Ulmus minor]
MEENQSASESSVYEDLTDMFTTLWSNPLSSFDNYVKDELEEILPSLEHLLSQKDALGLEPAGKSNYSGVKTRVSERSRPTPVADESDFCGREEIKETIIKLLRTAGVGGDKVSVIPVIGAGGLGKTTLVQIIYDLPEVEQLFGKVRAWVTVSTEFDLPTITKTILGMIADPSVINGNENLQVLLFKLRDALKGKRFLLVLDDVWSEDRGKWNTLKSCFKSAESGSKIIVTTRSAKVASIMAPNQQHHFLLELPDKDCLVLFAQTVFGDDEDPEAYSDLQEIGEKIVRKCKGNPLSVVTVGGILCGERRPEKWEKILESSLWELLQKDNQDIIPSLWLSYLYLPSEIKPCFAYCSIFPKDHQFQKEEVVQLWMAEGFLQNEAGKSGITMEEVGKRYFEELISRSLFQRSNIIYRESFIMHDLVHDLAMNVSGEFCFCLEGEKNLRDLSCKTRYLSCNMAIQDVKIFEGLSKARRLHSFVGLRPLTPIGVILKVLEESAMEGGCLPCSKLTHLPDSIGNLKHLRDLDLSRTAVEKLPDSVGTLYDLQTLLLSGLQNVDDVLKGNLEDKKNLSKLVLQWKVQTDDSRDSRKEKTLLDALQPHANLKELVIFNYGGTSFPYWLGDSLFSKIEKMCLNGCQDCLFLPSLGRLSSLKELKIEGFHKLETIDDEFYGNDSPFKSLEVLYFSDMREWKRWSVIEVPHLKELQLKGCPKLIEGLSNCNTITTLRIDRCPKLEFSGNQCRYPSLESLQIRQSCCSIKRLSLEHLTKLNELELKELDCLVELTGESSNDVKGLIIEKCPNLEFLGNSRYGSLKNLHIRNCEALKSIPLDYFPKLNELTLRYCQNFKLFRFAEEPPLVLESLTRLELECLPKFVSFPEGGLPAPSLKEFRILECENLRSLPQHMHRLLPSLNSLWVNNCGEIEWWPEGGLPSNLESLVIWGCKKLAAQVKHWDLQVTCLRQFSIAGCGEELLDSFPPEGLLPTSLTSLSISNFRRLKTLNIHAFQHLNTLIIVNCDELQCLSEERLPSSLSYLSLLNCPLLERQYQKETGEGWHKISHIPRVLIDGRAQRRS